jgi:methyl-accepting chemotaxis protein
MGLKLSAKLPALFVCVAVVTAAITGGMAYYRSKTALFMGAKQNLEAVAASRKHELALFIDLLEKNVATVATSGIVRDALKGFSLGWTLDYDTPVQTLQGIYQRGADKDRRLAFNGPEKDDATYSGMHVQYHPWFRDLLKRHKYEDVLLVNTEGDVVYSAVKNKDFATNLKTGPWKNTGLARAALQAMATPDQTIFVDFEKYAPSGGAAEGFLAHSVRDVFGEVVGAFVVQAPISSINSIMTNADGMGVTGETILVGADNMLRSESRIRNPAQFGILKGSVQNAATDDALAGRTGLQVLENADGSRTITAYMPVQFFNTKYALLASIDFDEAHAAATAVGENLLITIVVVMLVMSGIGLVLARQIINPLERITAVMQRLANRDLAVDVPCQQRTDEVGAMAQAVQVFKKNAVEVQRLEQEQKELERKNAASRKAELLQLADSFQQSVGGAVSTVATASETLQDTAENMNNLSSRTTAQATTVADSAARALSNVETVASAAEELSASIHEITGQVSRSTSIADDAVVQVNQTNEQVRGLAQSAERIGEAVRLITDIAEQTNLLALNATIEAARAGDAGKGFAVVANEVKALATQTARATEEISSQVISVQGETRTAVEAIERIGGVIANVNDITNSIAAAVEEQGLATQEIARNVQEAAVGTRGVNDGITDVSDAAQASGAISGEVLNAADMLATNAEILQKEIADFLLRVREKSD